MCHLRNLSTDVTDKQTDRREADGQSNGLTDGRMDGQTTDVLAEGWTLL